MCSTNSRYSSSLFDSKPRHPVWSLAFNILFGTLTEKGFKEVFKPEGHSCRVLYGAFNCSPREMNKQLVQLRIARMLRTLRSLKMNYNWKTFHMHSYKLQNSENFASYSSEPLMCLCRTERVLLSEWNHFIYWRNPEITL